MNKQEKKDPETELPVVATEFPLLVGHKFSVGDGETREVVRQLTEAQVKKLAPIFYQAIKSHMPPGIPVFWSEYRLVCETVH